MFFSLFFCHKQVSRAWVMNNRSNEAYFWLAALKCQNMTINRMKLTFLITVRTGREPIAVRSKTGFWDIQNCTYPSKFNVVLVWQWGDGCIAQAHYTILTLSFGSHKLYYLETPQNMTNGARDFSRQFLLHRPSKYLFTKRSLFFDL